jgi:hypothetical protein
MKHPEAPEPIHDDHFCIRSDLRTTRSCLVVPHPRSSIILTASLYSLFFNWEDILAFASPRGARALISATPARLIRNAVP